jgi:hypothetical protein
MRYEAPPLLALTLAAVASTSPTFAVLRLAQISCTLRGGKAFGEVLAKG